MSGTVTARQVEALIERIDGHHSETGAHIGRPDGKVCVEAHATFSVLAADQANDVGGAELGEQLSGFVQ